MTGDEDSEVVLNNNSSCTQISSNSVTQQKNQQVRKNDSAGSNGSSFSSEEGSRQISGQGRSTELVSEVSSVSGEPLTSLGHPSKNSVFSENDADIISTTALSNSPSVDSNSEVFISGASTSTSALCGNGEPTIGGGENNGGTPSSQALLQLSTDAQTLDEPDHVTLSESDLASANLDQMVQVYHQLQNYIHKLKGKNQNLKDSEEKLRLQQNEASRRENILVMRLATKDQELQEYAAQINELKTSVAPSTSSLKNSLLDPAVNFVILKMKKELTETKKKLEDTQNDLNAWKFTADSNTGKRLMAKCRMLYQENEDLGRMITSGRLAKLESDLALQKSLTEEMKKAQSEMDDLVLELDEDVEGMQSTILFLQQQLREKLSTVSSNEGQRASQSSEHLVSVNTSELCSQCRAEQENRRLNHTIISSTKINANDKVVKMEVDDIDEDDIDRSPLPLNIDEGDQVEEEDDHDDDNDSTNDRTQDKVVILGNERTLQNGECSSPSRAASDESLTTTTTNKRTSTRAARLKVNSNAESTSTSALNNKLGLSDPNNTKVSKSNNSKTNPTSSSLDEPMDSENTVKPPLAKRTKLSGNNNRSSNSNTSGDISQLQNNDETKSLVQNANSRNRNSNGAVDHA